MSLKKVIPMTVLCLLSASAFSGLASAQQGPDDTFAVLKCAIDPLTGGMGTENGTNSVFTDLQQGQAWDPSELKDTDPGEFSIGVDVRCSGADDASEHKSQGPETIPLTRMAFVAKGVYDNQVCQTGEFKGYATVRGDLGAKNLANAGGLAHINTIFDIRFVGGLGRLTGVVQKEGQSAPDPTSRVGQNEIDQGGMDGAIKIVARRGGEGGPPCIGVPGAQGPGDVFDYEISGSFTLTLAGEGTTTHAPLSDSDA